MLNETVSGLSVAAAQLVEAACCARDGNTEAAKKHIAQAVALLNNRLIARGHEGDQRQIQRGGLALWQARRVAAHVDANLEKKISTPQLAKCLNLSASHFCRAFKCTFGVSPHYWVMRRRMEMAQGLMLSTSATLSEIAFICGMADQAHFTHCFRRIFGDTPYAWRRTRRGTMPVRAADTDLLCTSMHHPGAGRVGNVFNRSQALRMLEGDTLMGPRTAVPSDVRGTPT
jgi:AraC-like DNA-binding protein